MSNHLESRIVHAGWDAAQDPHGAVTPPLQLSTTFAQKWPGQPGEYEYARSANPTRAAYERALGDLEGGWAFAFASGLAAIDTVVRVLCQPGQRILVGGDVYGGTHRLLVNGYPDNSCTVVDLSDPVAVTKELAAGDVGALWCETPSNPRLELYDISALAKIAHSEKAALVVDNTFATPYLQTPLALGADVVVHSGTKYIAGHSDSVNGIAATSSVRLADAIRWRQNAVGAVCSPFDAWLSLRGLRTLAVRMDRSCASAFDIARFLQRQQTVDAVYYPTLTHGALARTQMRCGGAMVSFTVKGGTDEVNAVAGALKVFTLAESLGAVESLVCVPAAMTHASVRGTELEVPDNLIRLSVGIEHVDDLTLDLKNALGLLGN